MLQPSEEIKSKIDIVDLIREYIPLKAAGINFRARCPFHNEKTPSFMVSTEKQIWHCFGCGKGGDIFAFIMEIEGLNFAEALRLLASKAGVVLRKQNPQLASQRNRLLDIHESAGKFFHKFLLAAPAAESIRKYLAGRGLTAETIDEWMIGYAPDSWDSIFNFLKQQGFSENEIFLSGLSVRRENRAGFYDRFRGRIMFPISDMNGSIVAFSGRINPAQEAAEKMGKYINSPQTDIYDKSKILFGLDKAKREIKKQDMAIIVEGQMDAITAQQAGFKNVVASSGTALTSEQISIIKRYTANIALAFDMDAAGKLAADRGIREAMAAEMNIKVIILPVGKDPDECIRRDPQSFALAVANAKPMMQYHFDKAFAGLDMDQVEHRRQAAKILLPIIAGLGNNIEQDFWLKKLSEKIDVAANLLRETLPPHLAQRRKSPEESKKDAAAPSIKTLPREERLSELLLALIIRFPSLLEYALNNIQIDQIVGQASQSLYRNLIFYYNNGINDADNINENKERIFNYNVFKHWLTHSASGNQIPISDQLGTLNKLVLLGDKDFYDLEIEQAKNEAIKIIAILKKYFKNKRMKEIEKLIAEFEQRSRAGSGQNMEEVEELMQEFKTLADESEEIKY